MRGHSRTKKRQRGRNGKLTWRAIAKMLVEAAITAMIGLLIEHVIQDSKSSAPKW